MSEPPLANLHQHPLTTTMAREYRKGNWTLQETLILITAKKLDDQRRLIKTTTHDVSSSSSGRNSSRSSGELRWKWVENYCWSHGCLRSQNQCNDKWDNLLRDYKKVRDYEVVHHHHHEFPSYWNMEKHQRKDKKLPSNMLLQLYQAVTRVLLQNKPLLQPQPHVPPLLLTSPPSEPPPPQPQAPVADYTTPAASEGLEESSDTEYNDSDDNKSESKRRKFDKKKKKLGSSILRSASELARALGSCEEKKEKRHREMMELHQRRLHMEETRNQMNHQGFTNLVTAVTNLTGSIQSLVHCSMAKDNNDGGGDGDNGDACSS